MHQQSWIGRLTINYTTLTLCQANMDAPFNDWTATHVNQGFSWRPGSVSFGTMDTDAATAAVLTELCPSYTPVPQALRIIKVPFAVGKQGVEITSPISDSLMIPIPEGLYALFFAIEPDETGKPVQPWKYHLVFVPAREPAPVEFIRADSELAPPQQLLMDAKPAR